MFIRKAAKELEGLYNRRKIDSLLKTGQVESEKREYTCFYLRPVTTPKIRRLAPNDDLGCRGVQCSIGLNILEDMRELGAHCSSLRQ